MEKKMERTMHINISPNVTLIGHSSEFRNKFHPLVKDDKELTYLKTLISDIEKNNQALQKEVYKKWKQKTGMTHPFDLDFLYNIIWPKYRDYEIRSIMRILPLARIPLLELGVIVQTKKGKPKYFIGEEIGEEKRVSRAKFEGFAMQRCRLHMDFYDLSLKLQSDDLWQHWVA